MKEQIKIHKIKGNPDNPRVIKNDKFKKLVKSIKEFPEMLELRPIVVDEEMMVLGGNMRLRACMEAGLKEVWIEVAKDLTEEQKKEFIVKDNASFGEWDWDVLANEWDSVKLADWGIDVWENEDDREAAIDEEEIEFSEYLDESNNYVVLFFDNDIDWLSAQTHFDIDSKYSRRQNGKPWSKGVGRVLNGGKYLKEIKKI